MPNRRPGTDRKYPALYEKAVPIALSIIALAVAALLVIVVAVVVGVLPGGA